MQTKEPLHKTFETELRRRINMMQPNDKIPTEYEFCSEFSISRHTVNKVISRLSDEGLLYRLRKRGTFISSQPARNKKITMLLPGPGTLARKDKQAFVMRELLNGLVDEGQRLNLSINTMMSTADHKRQSLKPENFKGFTSDDNLFILSHWWLPVFEAIAESGCNVVYCGMLPDSLIRGMMSNWYKFQLDTEGSVERMVDYFSNMGRKKILCLGLKNGFTQEDPIITGYKRGLENNGIIFKPELMPDFDYLKYSTAVFEGNIEPFRRIVMETIATEKFDALIIPSSIFCEPIMKVLQELGIGVPEDVAAICTSDAPDMANLKPSVSCFKFNFYNIGVEAAKLFARNSFMCGETLFQADFIERKSSSIGDVKKHHKKNTSIVNSEVHFDESFVFI